ncbi:hypothetical protein ACHAXS_008377 [Conticribra weissflogii]
MKIAAISSAIAITLGVASAAPAVVWKNGSSSSSPSHISDRINSRSLLSSSIVGDDSSALAAVVFLVGRDADGSEGLANLASTGKLPQVQKKYGVADSIHHHVDGVESSRTMARDARNNFDGKVVEVTLDEFNRKLASIAQTTLEEAPMASKKAEQKRRREISEADVLIVNVNPSDDASSIDSSIVSAIESSAVKNVILSSIRSTEEVKHARKLAVLDRFTKTNTERVASRRLQDQNNNNNNGGDDSNEGVYYVNMTPNMFSGILFFFMFIFTAHLGLTCMNMIEGQDVYVKKMPHIGREV